MKEFGTNNKPFNLPENYFNQLEESILIETKKFSENDALSTPENYFSDLENRILVQTIQKNKQGKVKQLWIAVSSVAACLVLVAVFLAPQLEDKYNLTLSKSKVDKKTENAVYKSLYDVYFEEEDQKKSSNDITLDDLDEFYSEQHLSSNN